MASTVLILEINTSFHFKLIWTWRRFLNGEFNFGQYFHICKAFVESAKSCIYTWWNGRSSGKIHALEQLEYHSIGKDTMGGFLNEIFVFVIELNVKTRERPQYVCIFLTFKPWIDKKKEKSQYLELFSDKTSI